MRSAMYPRIENGKRVVLPEYNSFSDPHLTEYYARKFGVSLPTPPKGVRYTIHVKINLKGKLEGEVSPNNNVDWGAESNFRNPTVKF